MQIPVGTSLFFKLLVDLTQSINFQSEKLLAYFFVSIKRIFLSLSGFPINQKIVFLFFGVGDGGGFI